MPATIGSAAAGPSAAVGTGFEPDPGRKCGTAPKPYWKWSSVTKKYVLTHHAVVENYTSKAGSRTKTMAVSATVTAAVTFTTSAKVSASLPIGGLEGQTSLSLQASGARTTSSTVSETYTVQPNTQITETRRLFAGAKRNLILSGYEQSLDLPRFVYAIDWGFLFFLTRPIFWLIEFFYGILGNFGLAILALTLVVRLIMFPLANKSYESMSKMRNLQPRMEEIKKKHPDEPQKQQQEIMALYQREKINPLAGCLPLLLQIPVFYAVYKMLFVTIEMRHQPFFGWIRDLSAPDPTSIWNLFGLLPWDPASAPLIGGLLGGTFALSVLAIFYGLTMWLQMAMSPQAPDPMQRRIFQLMPILFTFIMATFPAGLLIYWAWSNILTIFQQYIIMHRLKAANPIDDFLARMKKAKA